MKRDAWYRIAAPLLLALALSALPAHVWGQPPGGMGFRPFGPMGGDKLMLLAQPAVQDELKLDDKQLKLVKQRLDKQRSEFEKLRELEPEDVEQHLAKQAKSTNTALGRILNAEQSKRLNEISLQRRGAQALTDPDVAKSLKLTGAQKNRLLDIQDDAMGQMQSVFGQLGGPGGPGPGGPGGPGRGFPGGGPNGPRPLPPNGIADGVGGPPGVNPQGNDPANPEGAIQQRRTRPGRQQGPGNGGGQGPNQAAREEGFKKMKELRQTVDEKLLGVLTSQQKTKWQELQGKPFEAELGPPGGRGGPPEGAPGEGPPGQNE